MTIAQADENRNVIEETKRYIECDTLLLSVGLIPENELTAQAGIGMDRITSGAIVDENCQTLAEGVWEFEISFGQLKFVEDGLPNAFE